MKRLSSFLAIFFMLYSMPALALMPVIDVASIVKLGEMLIKANDQINQLTQLNKTNENQYHFLQKNLNGNFGYGNLLNDTAAMERRQWSNDSWTDVLKESSSSRTSGFANAQRKYDELYPVKDARDILSTRGSNNLERTHYQQSHEISRAALAASSYSYDQINEHIKNIHDILAKLESESSEKAAMDLNTRLVAEVGFIQLEMLRQQNIQTQLLANNTQGEVNGMSEQSKFMKWP